MMEGGWNEEKAEGQEQDEQDECGGKDEEVLHDHEKEVEEGQEEEEQDECGGRMRR